MKKPSASTGHWGFCGTYGKHFAYAWPRVFPVPKQSPRLPQEQEMVKREIEATDSQIDRLVYELYGLNEDEIAIVEQR